MANEDSEQDEVQGVSVSSSYRRDFCPHRAVDFDSQIADQHADPRAPTRVFSYLISRTFDDKGNLAVYIYKRENADRVNEGLKEDERAHEANRGDEDRTRHLYLKSIRYGNVQ